MDLLKRSLKKILKNFGFTILKTSNQNNYIEYNSMSGAINRCKNLFIEAETIIDVGAAAGTWTQNTLKLFPESNFLLVEPLIERKNELEALALKFPKVKVLFMALGKFKETLPFTVTSDLDGSGFYEDGALREIEVIDLDSVLLNLNLEGPFILKLDTHGFEIPILQGAMKMLTNTNLLIVEVYGFKISPGSFLFWEMTQYLEQLGFKLYDIADVMRRPKDNAFWQCDAFFLRKDNPVFFSNTYD